MFPLRCPSPSQELDEGEGKSLPLTPSRRFVSSPCLLPVKKESDVVGRVMKAGLSGGCTWEELSFSRVHHLIIESATSFPKR